MHAADELQSAWYHQAMAKKEITASEMARRRWALMTPEQQAENISAATTAARKKRMKLTKAKRVELARAAAKARWAK